MAAQPLLLDRYRIIDEAGSGGYAVVLHAYDTRLKRDVAIKSIDLTATEEARAHLPSIEAQLENGVTARLDGLDQIDFDAPPRAGEATGNASDPSSSIAFDAIPGLEEAQTAAHLSDPNIVTVYDCEFHKGVAYIIMEYVKGKTLSQVIDEEGDDITLDMIAAVFTSVAHALKAAHKKKVLHLDIKPDNVIINEQGVVKVTDFGLATLADASGHGKTGGGTIGYMPLEQMRQEPLDVRTDEWSLAALTYEMLTGTNPFFADDLDDAERAIEDAELVLPSLCWQNLDPEADDVIFNALSPDPEHRYDTTKEFADALAPFLGNARTGKQELAEFVNQDEEDDSEEDAPAEPEIYEPLAPLVDRIGARGASVIMRALSVAGTMVLGAVSCMNIHLTPGSTFGLAADFAILYWLILIGLGVVAAIRPHVGALLGFVLLGVAYFVNNAYLLGIAIAGVALIWWLVVGMRGSPQATSLLLQPLMGSVGFAALSPIVAGCLLPVGQAVLTSVVAVFMALSLASIGSGNLMGWNILINAQFGGIDLQLVFINTLRQPAVWCVAASWVAAAFAYSLFCVRGTHRFDVAGSFCAAILLIVGVVIGTGMQSHGMIWTPDVFPFMGALIPGIVGILLAFLEVPDRARWDENEWRDLEV